MAQTALNLNVNFNQIQQQCANIEAIDYFFAKEILAALIVTAELTDDQQQLLFYLFMALSASLRAGHTCLPIAEIADEHWGIALDELGKPSHQGYVFSSLEALNSLLAELDISPDDQQPIVFDNSNLYMRRYFQFEWEVVHGIHQRLTQQTSVPYSEISTIVSQLFPLENAVQQISQTIEDQPQEIDWQKVAVANAINKSFTVIAGGPGTGKTYTVTKLLAALLMLHVKNNVADMQPLEIALVAPTGKAAQRLSESIIKAIEGFKGLIDDKIFSIMPTQAKTIHRLLGVIPNSPNFRNNQNNRLSCDVLLIDEVSMVDLPMMARIFRALKPDTKIILLGDADQLPSVAVGSVLADIAPRPHCGYSQENLAYLEDVCHLDSNLLKKAFEDSILTSKAHSVLSGNSVDITRHDHLSFLMKSRRFDGEGGIGKLASFVIQGKSELSWQLLEPSTCNESQADTKLSTSLCKEKQLTLVDNNLNSWLTSLVEKYYQQIAECADIAQAFALLLKFRVLCVTRQGEFGVDALNQRIKEQLLPSYQSTQANYHGMPIMISENDYRLGLFNGDIGLLWHSDDGNLMAFFENSEEGKPYKIFIPSRLPKYDAVYAMTIHKTQGSEFDHVVIVLPKQAEHQLLSRELLYTGITRAKTALTIASNKQTWCHGVKREIKRHSGLIL